MLNQLILVGRFTKDLELEEAANGKLVTTATLAVQRNYKNQETNEYDTDFLKVTLWEGIAKNTVEHCKKGSTVGIKARLASKKYYYGEQNEHWIEYPEIIAEKVTFIQL